jgi:hypothetical protein
MGAGRHAEDRKRETNVPTTWDAQSSAVNPENEQLDVSPPDGQRVEVVVGAPA